MSYSHHPRVSVVIPARLASSRLPRKVLADLGGRPVIRHVWDNAVKIRDAIETIVATDSEEVAQAVAQWGAQFVLTSPGCRSGTERIASILDGLHGDFILNLQGDEPFLNPAVPNLIVEHFAEHGGEVVTPVYPIREVTALANPSVVKAVRARDGRALYFSRAAVPHVRGAPEGEWPARGLHWGHIGLYGFARATLARYSTLPPSALEDAEGLEQLRWLEAGWRIQTVETDFRSEAIDTPEDLARARETLKLSSTAIA